MEDLPTKAVVVGAGYIAVELAGVLNGLGVDTHLVVRYVLEKYHVVIVVVIIRVILSVGVLPLTHIDNIK
jgi:glutathione reductase (NADPH)